MWYQYDMAGRRIQVDIPFALTVSRESAAFLRGFRRSAAVFLRLPRRFDPRFPREEEGFPLSLPRWDGRETPRFRFRSEARERRFFCDLSLRRASSIF